MQIVCSITDIYCIVNRGQAASGDFDYNGGTVANTLYFSNSCKAKQLAVAFCREYSMKYIWCNIKNFFKHKKLIFILTVFSVICSCIMIHFSYGLYQNYQLKKEYDLSDEREIALSLQGDFDEESDKELNDDESYFKPVDSVDNYITIEFVKEICG